MFGEGRAAEIVYDKAGPEKAAGIATLAKKSFAYPNAIILHHQMSTMNWGNMTQIKEQYEKAKEWERRVLEPFDFYFIHNPDKYYR